jgi:hypothetical protein
MSAARLRPISVLSESARVSFNTLGDAAEYIAPLQSDRWTILMPLELELSGELIDVDGVESLRLTTCDKTGTVPRYKYHEHESGISVATAPKLNLDIITIVSDYNESKLLDRGVVWLRVARSISPVLFHANILRNHQHSAELIEKTITEAGKATMALTMAALDSQPILPFSHDMDRA